MKPPNTSQDVTRRNFLRGSVAALALPAGMQALSSTAVAQQQPPDGAAKLTAYHEAELGGKVRGPHLWLRWDNEVLTSYRAHQTQKYPYFFPLNGPVSGQSLTAETALPWPHHRSVYFSCDRVSGANYWQQGLERGQIKSTGPEIVETTDTSAVIRDACEWAVPGDSPQMSDSRKFTIKVENPRLWTIDAEIEWKAIVDIEVTKTNHALFSVRCAPDISSWGGGTLESSEGNVGEADTFGKPARWCAFYDKRRRAINEVVEGIALFDHPKNPWNPCPWFTRDYGMISPMPFQWITEPWRLPAGQSVNLKYKVVAFAGDPREAELTRGYSRWAGA
jgi:hypothetical protein